MSCTNDIFCMQVVKLWGILYLANKFLWIGQAGGSVCVVSTSYMLPIVYFLYGIYISNGIYNLLSYMSCIVYFLYGMQLYTYNGNICLLISDNPVSGKASKCMCSPLHLCATPSHPLLFIYWAGTLTITIKLTFLISFRSLGLWLMQMEKHIMSCQEHGMKRWNVQRLCRAVKAMEVEKASRKPSTKPFRQSYCGRNTLYRKSSQRRLSVQIKFFLTLGLQWSI